MKFSTQHYLINISVEFEDENDPSRNGWVIEKIVIIDQTIPEGGYRDFFQKNIFPRIIYIGLFDVLIELYYRLSGVRSPNLKSDFQSDLPIG
jgi:hypothetical protein